MGVLEAFMATWSQARQTYGQSTPIGGAQFDGSASLRGLQAAVESAAPAAQWQGGAATAYGSANTEHAQVFGKLADLDTRLAAEIDKSAQVVTTGRSDLDDVRDWVVSAASSVPPNQAGEIMMMPIVSKGIGQLSDVMLRSNGALNTIGANIQQIGAEYASLSKQRFAPLPQNPQDDELPWDETTWYAEWEALNQEARANNSALAAHLRTRPPNGSPQAVVGPWNAQLSVLNANAHRIYREQLTKAAEAAEMGIAVEQPTPPPVVNDPEDVPVGAAPASSVSPAAAVVVAKRLPI